MSLIFCFNRNRSRLISQVLIRDEQEVSFPWVIEGLKRAAPCVIFSDADADYAMCNAFKEEFPETYFMSCIFHISTPINSISDILYLLVPKVVSQIITSEYMSHKLICLGVTI